MSVPPSVGMQLKQWRRTQDLTQAMLARRVGCAEITIQKIEAGALRPSRQIVERLADALALPDEERQRFAHLARHNPPASSQPFSFRLFEAGAAQTSHVPIPPTPLFGRTQETAAVCTALLRRDVRLLTLIGPPGVGKTRLALAVARQMEGHFNDGVFFVNLAAVNHPDHVISAIAHSLNLPERANQKLEEQLVSVLHGHNLLLILDNFEHLNAAAPKLADLLAASGEYKLLITSRVVLHVSVEHVFSVAPLPTPDLASTLTPAALAEQPAIALFVARACAVKSNFALTATNAPAVAAICERLDGLPLAIELAAVRSKLFSPATLLKRLQQRLPLLTGGAQDLPTRQQTLRGAIDWSYQLLNEREKALLDRLAIFSGGCTVEAVEVICSNQAPDTLDLLAMLLDKSLVHQQDDGEGEPRFALLYTIREYAWERLAERGELVQIRRRHIEYYKTVAEQAEPAFEGNKRAQQQAWLLYFDREQDNVRAALQWAYTTPEGIRHGVDLTAALWQFWWIRGYLTEGRKWVALALNHVPAAGDAPAIACLRAKLLNQAGFLAYSQADYAAAACHHEESLALATKTDDKQAIADAYIGLANIAGRQNDYQRAELLFTQCAALFQEIQDLCGYAWSLAGLANMARIYGDYARTHLLLEESRCLFQALGYQRGLAYIVSDLGWLAHDEGEFATAETLYNESLVIFAELVERHAIAGVLTNLGNTTLRLGNYSRAAIHFRESLTLCRELADQAGIAANLMGLASAFAGQGQTLHAARLWGAAEMMRERIGVALLPAEQVDYANSVTATRARATSSSFEAAWQAGRTLSPDSINALVERLSCNGQYDDKPAAAS